MAFGDRLKKLREQKGWAQQDVADKLNISRATVAGYETKGKIPRDEVLIRIADLFQTTIDYLLGRIDHSGNTNKLIDDNSNEIDMIAIKKAIMEKELVVGKRRLSKEEQEMIRRILIAAIQEEEAASFKKSP